MCRCNLGSPANRANWSARRALRLTLNKFRQSMFPILSFFVYFIFIFNEMQSYVVGDFEELSERSLCKCLFLYSFSLFIILIQCYNKHEHSVASARTRRTRFSAGAGPRPLSKADGVHDDIVDIRAFCKIKKQDKYNNNSLLDKKPCCTIFGVLNCCAFHFLPSTLIGTEKCAWWSPSRLCGKWPAAAFTWSEGMINFGTLSE